VLSLKLKARLPDLWVALSLGYEAKKLRARFSEVEEAFKHLSEAVEACVEALERAGEGRVEARGILAHISKLLEALGRFEHELSHVIESAASSISAVALSHER